MATQQNIKCVVVGDGAVGILVMFLSIKISQSICEGKKHKRPFFRQNLSANCLHGKRLPWGVCSNCV